MPSDAKTTAQEARKLHILRNRSAFLAAARALKSGQSGFMLQARDRKDGEASIGVGFTCSKKLGNAVTRNRAKRRLREIARSELPKLARPGWDYVLVGRPKSTVARDFIDLKDDLTRALTHLHRSRT